MGCQHDLISRSDSLVHRIERERVKDLRDAVLEQRLEAGHDCSANTGSSTHCCSPSGVVAKVDKTDLLVVHSSAVESGSLAEAECHPVSRRMLLLL